MKKLLFLLLVIVACESKEKARTEFYDYSINIQQYKFYKNSYLDRSLFPPRPVDCESGGVLKPLHLKFCEKALDFPEADPMLQSTVILRGKRSEVEKYADNRDAKSRKHRAIPGNPCASDISIGSYFYYGKLAGTDTIVEIVQDAVNEIYQLFYIYPCIQPYFFQIPCQPTGIEYIANVFTGNGYETALEQVELATTCNIFVQSG